MHTCTCDPTGGDGAGSGSPIGGACGGPADGALCRLCYKELLLMANVMAQTCTTTSLRGEGVD